MSLLPTIRAKYGEGIGVELFFMFPDISDNEKTYFDADTASGVTSISANGVNFSVGQYIIIGQAGNERSEIVQIHASTPPTSTTITLAAATTFAHNRGDQIQFIPYNQIEAQYSTDAVTYNVVTPVAIRADATETYMQRASDLSTYSYKFRFYNSTSALYSAYSSVASATGYADNTIWSVKNRALSQLGEVVGQLITNQFLDDAIQEARRSLDQWPAVFRWSFRTQFGAILGQMLAGQWQITAPSDLRDRNTYKNILSLRFGSQNRPIVYPDPVRFNQNYLNVNHSTLTNAVVFGGTSIVLGSTHDFDATGSVTVAGQTPGQGTFTLSYTGNNKTTNTLSGVTGIPAAGIAAGTNIWQRGVFGLPTAYTIDNGTISFDVPLLTTYDGQDAKIDYYSIIPPITSDSQTFDEPFYDLYVPFLKYKIKYLKANGKIDRDGDTDWKDWLDGAAKMIGQETPGQRINFIPDIEGFLSATE